MAGPGKFPPRQRVAHAEDLANITFVNDMAEIDVPVDALDVLPLKNDERCDSPRLHHLMGAIRHHGYCSVEPVIVRLGRRGRWVVVDGGHRLTAARRVAKEFFANLFGRKVRYIHFLLYRTPLSESRLGEPEPQEPVSHQPETRTDP